MSLSSKLVKVYNQIPLSFLNTIAPLYHMLPMRLRYGNTFCKQYLMLQQNEQEGVEEEIERLFLETVKNAYENVPYYNELFHEKKLSLNDIASLEDIKRIPFLDKDIVRQNKERLLSRKVVASQLNYVTTSGSTGNPVGFYQDKELVMREWAYVNHIWNRVGYLPNDSRLVLRGKVFREMKLHGKNWQWDAFKRELSVNVFDMTDKTLPFYCGLIEKYKPRYIHGYMSAIKILCKYVENNPLKHNFQAVLAVSENVLQGDREYVERVLKARVFSFYGHSERLAMAAECEYSTDYHVEPLYGFVELVDENGKVINQPGIEGEIVTTGFMNKSMPLIRYKTGDVGIWSEGVCRCGRQHKRLKYVKGHWSQDILVGSYGEKVSAAAINMHSCVYEHILKYQFFQDKAGEIVFLYVPLPNFENKEETQLLEELSEKLGKGFTIVFKKVDDIPLEKNGKYKLLNQHMNVRDV